MDEDRFPFLRHVARTLYAYTVPRGANVRKEGVLYIGRVEVVEFPDGDKAELTYWYTIESGKPVLHHIDRVPVDA